MRLKKLFAFAKVAAPIAVPVVAAVVALVKAAKRIDKPETFSGPGLPPPPKDPVG